MTVAFLGAAYDAESLPHEIESRPPVVMIHREADPIVPFATMTAKQPLKSNDEPAKSRRRPGLAHEMDDDDIVAAGALLTAIIVSNPATVGHHGHDGHDEDHYDHARQHEHH